MRGRYDYLHGDEDELQEEAYARREAYYEEHADDWKYSDDRLQDGVLHEES
jgi:hypothetical protein